MTQLRNIQHALQNFLQGKPSTIETYVVGKNKDEVSRRLAVYREAYQLRLADNIRKQYPTIAAWCGKDRFTALAHGYDALFPPTDPLIRHYASHFADYLHSIDEPCLAEVAMFEWAMNVALDERLEQPLMTAQDFQAVSAEALLALTFSFHPSLQVVDVHYDIPAFWTAMKQAKQKKLPTRLAVPIQVAVWRKHYAPYFRTMEPLETMLFTAAAKQQDFSDLCGQAAESLQEGAVAFVAQMILRWLQDGWLCVPTYTARL